MIKAVIFDLDGVLADTEHMSSQADDTVLARHGIWLTEEEKIRAYGRRMEEIFGDVIRDRGLRIDVSKLVGEKDSTFEELIKGSLKPMQGAGKILAALKKTGLKIGLATSSGSKKMENTLNELSISGYFDVMSSGDHVQKGKPHPEVYIKTAKKLGVEPAECIVVEDSEFGIMSAKAAGMMCIAIKSPNTRGQDFSGADYLADSLAGVEKEIERVVKAERRTSRREIKRENELKLARMMKE